MPRRKRYTDEPLVSFNKTCDECGQELPAGEICSSCNCCPTHCDCDPLDRILGNAVDRDDDADAEETRTKEDDDDDDPLEDE